MGPPLFAQLDDAFAADGGDVSLQVAHASLAGVVVNDFEHGILHEGNLVFLETMRLELTGNQVPLAICSFSRAVYPSIWMISMRSRSGPGMVSN
jgi:hypothetical protein